VTCEGTAFLHRNIDIHAICRILESRYFGTNTPNKCKIGIA